MELERTILYVLHRFSRLARESGYNELSIACFQGLIELNLFRPETPPPTSEFARNDELDRFEEFWDSECPRFGEEGAKGWRAFDPDDLVDVSSTTKEVSEDWYHREEESKNDMPARTTDEVDDDPYRVILFNDIRPFLYAFTTNVVNQLPYTFISFCGVNLPFPEISSNQMTDPWLPATFDFRQFWPPPSTVDSIEWINGEVVEPQRLPGIITPFSFPKNVFPHDIDSLFPDSWFGLMPSEPHSLNTHFLSTALRQLNTQDEHLIIIHLSIENILSPGTVLKLVKSYLKPRKTSLPLYNVYALLLWQRNSYEEARKVWRTAIEMTATTHANPILLWRTWIMAEFALDEEKARDLYGQIFLEKVALRGAGEMIVRKTVRENFERSLSFRLAEVGHYAHLMVLLEYLTIGLDAAITKCQNLTNELAEKDMQIAQERLLLSTSKIIYHHTQVQGWYRIATLRDFWSFAIAQFPHNTAFQSLFVWNEANARIDGRVRKLLTSLEKSATVDDWIFTIWCSVTVEHGRTSLHSTRALFEKALEKWYVIP